MAYEETLVLLKPDAVRRRLIGRIILRFEDAGLEIRTIRIIKSASPELISNHYRSTDEWLRGVGEKTLRSYKDKNMDIFVGFGTDNAIEIGKIVKERLIRYMTSSPIIAMIIGGNNAIKKIRDIAGYTIPAEALPGTIRGDYSCDSPDLATSENRSVENLIHASGNSEEARYEISLWF